MEPSDGPGRSSVEEACYEGHGRQGSSVAKEESWRAAAPRQQGTDHLREAGDG